MQLLSLFHTPSTYVRSPYNAYETVSAQSCITSTKGCCSSTSLTSLVLDTSVTYNCYTLNSPGVNDFAVSVRLTSAVHVKACSTNLYEYAVVCANCNCVSVQWPAEQQCIQ